MVIGIGSGTYDRGHAGDEEAEEGEEVHRETVEDGGNGLDPDAEACC